VVVGLGLNGGRHGLDSCRCVGDWWWIWIWDLVAGDLPLVYANINIH
jgi:hypothetical protein